MLSNIMKHFYHPPAGVLLPFAHAVSDAAPAHIRHLYAVPTVKKFTADLDRLCCHYKALDISEFEKLVLGHNDGSVGRRGFLISFDDGMRESHEVIAPILRSKGIPAIFFINSAIVDNRRLMWRHKISLLIEQLGRRPQRLDSGKGLGKRRVSGTSLRASQFGDEPIIDDIARRWGIDFDGYLRDAQPYLTTEQVLDLARWGFAIGAHTHRHPQLQELALEDQKQEILLSVEFVRSLGLACRWFAFPFHDTGASNALFAHMRSLGISLSFGTSAGRLDSVPFSFQRFTLEGDKATIGVDRILDHLSMKSMVRWLSGTDIIWRY